MTFTTCQIPKDNKYAVTGILVLLGVSDTLGQQWQHQIKWGKNYRVLDTHTQRQQSQIHLTWTTTVSDTLWSPFQNMVPFQSQIPSDHHFRTWHHFRYPLITISEHGTVSDTLWSPFQNMAPFQIPSDHHFRTWYRFRYPLITISEHGTISDTLWSPFQNTVPFQIPSDHHFRTWHHFRYPLITISEHGTIADTLWSPFQTMAPLQIPTDHHFRYPMITISEHGTIADTLWSPLQIPYDHHFRTWHHCRYPLITIWEHGTIADTLRSPHFRTWYCFRVKYPMITIMECSWIHPKDMCTSSGVQSAGPAFQSWPWAACDTACARPESSAFSTLALAWTTSECWQCIATIFTKSLTHFWLHPGNKGFLLLKFL